MRLLADEDVYFPTVVLLRQNGHDVVTVYDVGLSSTPDHEILRHALNTQRIMLTRDSDYGTLTYFQQMPSSGIIFLRMNPHSAPQVHSELLRILAEHAEEELRSLFVVVEPGRHRIRRLR